MAWQCVCLFRTPHAMTANLASYLRHAFTGWIAAAALYLTAKLMLDAAATQAVEQALKQIGDGLLLLIITLCPVIGRMVWSWAGSLFRRGSGENDTSGSGGNLGLWVIGAMAACLCGLPSCSPDQIAAARAIPIKTCVVTDKGTICYSSKSGLSAEIDATSGK